VNFQNFLRLSEKESVFLGSACLLYAISLFAGRFCKRRLRIALTWTYQLFIITLAVYVSAKLLQVNFPGRKEIGFLAMVAAAFPITAILDRFFWPLYGYPGERSRVPAFLPQVVALMLVVFAAFFGFAVFYHLTITGLLASSGVIAIIIGLALQDTLGNIFAGFGIQAGRTFKVGDWLLLDGQHVEVVELNWRSTRFRNNDEASFNIPNSQLAKATIVNLYYPTPVHAMRVKVGVEYRVPPNEVKEALIKAAVSVRGVLAEPAPQAFLMAFDDSSINYELKFWLRDGRRYPQIIDGIRTNCWYEFARRGISFAYPVRIIERTVPRVLDHDRKAELLGQQPLFAALDKAQIGRLVQSAKRIRFGKGETIIHQGEPGESMFILARGFAEVFVLKDGEPLRVGVVQTGECFGEVSLLTGEPRSATVTAQTDCEILEIQKSAMAALLHEHPQLAEQLSETLAVRRLATKSELERFEIEATETASVRTKESVLARLRLFFEL
jgi:small-conductance mechanosensitive channel/CRP-like cAMP-binding protein